MPFVVTSLVLVDFPAGLESSLRLLLASRGTRQAQHYRLLVISSNQDRRQTAHARTALTASACLVWVLLRASWFSSSGENPVPVCQAQRVRRVHHTGVHQSSCCTHTPCSGASRQSERLRLRDFGLRVAQ